MNIRTSIVHSLSRTHRIALIQADSPVTGTATAVPFSHYNQAEPLGLLCLASALENVGHDIMIVHANIDHPNLLTPRRVFQRIIDFAPDIAAFSCMTRQVLAARELAAQIRDQMPNVLTVVGGDHFSANPSDLSHCPEFDVAVSGEGEAAIIWIAAHLGLPWEKETVPAGIYWKASGAVVGTGVASRVCHLDELAVPKRIQALVSGSYVGALMSPPRSQQRGMVSMYASRGCPYNCSYCDAAQIWGRRVTRRAPEAVVQELRAVSNQYGVNTAFFVDLTFNADRHHLLSLCTALEEAQLDVSWYVLIRPGAPDSPLHVDEDILRALKRAGCTKVGFGVETISLEVSKDLNRLKGNGHLIDACRIMDNIGLLSKAFFIIGHPAETSQYYDQLAIYLDKLKADEVRMSFLTPFPGTPLWHQYRDQLPGLEGYDAYTTFEPLIPHLLFSPAELQRKRLRLITDYYSGRAYTAHVADKVRLHPNLRRSYDEFLGYVAEQTKLIAVAQTEQLQTMS